MTSTQNPGSTEGATSAPEGSADPAPLQLPRDAAEALYAAMGAALGVRHGELTAAAEEIAGLRAELDQLNRDCDARDETIRHLDAGLTHEREQVARLEAELVAARSAVDRVREAAQWGSRNYPGLRALNDRLATALDDPPAGETSCRPRCDDVRGIRGLLEHVGIDTSGRDITVAGRLVDAAPPAADETPAAAARIDQAGVNAAQGFLLLVDEFQQVMARVAVQLAEAPEQVVALQTPKQRALDILAPHLDDEPLYHPHA